MLGLVNRFIHFFTVALKSDLSRMVKHDSFRDLVGHLFMVQMQHNGQIIHYRIALLQGL